jgi:hypothetical protein
MAHHIRKVVPLFRRGLAALEHRVEAGHHDGACWRTGVACDD